MRILVLGAGVVGVSSAWYLAEAGHEVTVVDRQTDAGLETSFANGGQISVSHAEPWANPAAPAKVFKWLGHEDAPLLFRFRLDSAQWRWGMQFMLECLPGRARRNTLSILALATYSRDRLQALRQQTGIEYDCLTRGILHLFTDQRDYAAAVPKVELMRTNGLNVAIRTGAECVATEPTLADARVPLAGGLYAPDDESGDARKFTRNLAALAAAQGVNFRYEMTIEQLQVAGNRVTGVRVTDSNGVRHVLEADAYLLALGSYSPLLLRPLGEPAMIYPVKGYSVTIPTGAGYSAPTVSITDEAHKLVVSRLGERLRVAGTAELTGYDTSLNRLRCEAIVKRTFDLFPKAGNRAGIEFWTGLRPATPGNVPIIGRSRHANLFLNTGHGTLGWTLACGSGRAIADIMSGRKPQVNFPFRGAA